MNVNLGEVLGWKHNNEPGIMTADGVITQWPSSLGSMPDQATLDTWTTEYLAHLAGESVKAEAINKITGLVTVDFPGMSIQDLITEALDILDNQHGGPLDPGQATMRGKMKTYINNRRNILSARDSIITDIPNRNNQALNDLIDNPGNDSLWP